MRFTTVHRFRAAPPDVVACLADPRFHLALAVPDLGPAELLDHHVDGDAVALRFRYRYTGQLDPRVMHLLGRHPLTWVQDLHVDLAASAGTLLMHVEAVPAGLKAEASFTVSPAGDGGATRELRGTLVVGVPIVGPMAERKIVPGVEARLDVEAEAVDRWVTGS